MHAEPNGKGIFSWVRRMFTWTTSYGSTQNDWSGPPESAIPESHAELRERLQKYQQEFGRIKEINHQLLERNRVMMEFISQGALPQYVQRTDEALSSFINLQQAIQPILEECGGGSSPKRLMELKLRSKQLENDLLNLRTKVAQQRDSLLKRLQEKKFSLQLKESDIECLNAANRELQGQLQKMRIELARRDQEVKNKEELIKTLHQYDMKMKILDKQLRALLEERKLWKARQGLEEENKFLKKTVASMKQRLADLSKKVTLLQEENKTLTEEYARLFDKF